MPSGEMHEGVVRRSDAVVSLDIRTEDERLSPDDCEAICEWGNCGQKVDQRYNCTNRH